MSTVIVEPDTEIWIVTVNRPSARNAVDGPTARLLADAFRAFDATPMRRSPSCAEAASIFAAAPI